MRNLKYLEKSTQSKFIPSPSELLDAIVCMRKLQVITCVSPNWSLLLLAGNQMPASTQERLLVLKFRVSVFKPKDHIDHNYINIKGGSERPCSICFGRIVVISDTT